MVGVRVWTRKAVKMLTLQSNESSLYTNTHTHMYKHKHTTIYIYTYTHTQHAHMFPLIFTKFYNEFYIKNSRLYPQKQNWQVGILANGLSTEMWKNKYIKSMDKPINKWTDLWANEIYRLSTGLCIQLVSQ